MKIQKNDIVTRKSYGNDIVFKVENINGEMADLKGLSVRIVADSKVTDLVKIPEDELKQILERNLNAENMRISRCNRFNNRSNTYSNNVYKNIKNVMKEDMNEYTNQNISSIKLYKKTGTILHLDGDKEYTEKCKMMYSKLGLTSYVYYIPEVDQPKYVYSLLEKIKPNILILTGHDAFSKKSTDIYNVNNYKNSKYYVESINEARRYEHDIDSLVIYAGACQSYYEALITAGANFASSPKRVLIDIMDPIIIAQAIAYTSVDNYVSLKNLISNTREGIRGVGGLQTRGQCREGIPSI